MTDIDQRLTVSDLRDTFAVTDFGWVVYRRRDGSLGVQPTSKRGLANVAACVKSGGAEVLRATGVSRQEALAAARAKLGT